MVATGAFGNTTTGHNTFLIEVKHRSESPDPEKLEDKEVTTPS